MSQAEPREHLPPVEPDETQVADLGVLFVHGIGTQRRGDVVLQCGEAMHDWLDRWAENAPANRPGFRPRLVEASLSESEAPSSRPARARLVLESRQPDDEPLSSSWLLAESHWADSFRPPAYSDLLAWAFVALPRAVFLHSFNPVRSFREALEQRYPGARPGHVSTESVDPESNVEIVAKTLEAAVTLFAAPLVIFFAWLALLLIFALRLIPLEATRSAAGNIQRSLVATLGDSLLFSTSAMTEAAVVTRVQRDLAWLASRCRRVAIVAHSQGAAVSYRLLERLRTDRSIPENLVELVTYGSGLRKLTDLKQSKQSLARLALFGWLATALAAVSGLLCVYLYQGASAWVALALPLLFVSMTILVTAASVLIQRPEPEDPLTLDWLDFYASRDPVPNGPVDSRFWGPAGNERFDTQPVGGSAYRRRSVEVFNEHSILRDHTTYWSAGAGDFVGRIVRELARASGLPLITDDESGRLEALAGRKRRHATRLAGLRIAALVAAASTLFWQRGAVAALGAATSAWLESVSGSLSGAQATRLEAGMAWLAGRPLALGTVALALTLYATYAIARVGWLGWRSMELDRLFRRETSGPAGVGALLFCAGWAGLIAIPVLVAGRFSPDQVSVWLPTVGALWAAARLFPGPWIYETATRGPRRASRDR